ncbi:MAG: aryldialkylphosphatase [Acidimicrobiia bacterium]|nr:aryldialkylphosphatase [Acidimicrobiia bacterium]MDH3470175.1 aryldialkylphosphatase [Acidimicrobiia bacterium]
MIVRTVLGDIAPDELGATYLHEHLIIDSPLVADRLPHIRLPSADDAVAELMDCVRAGAGAMVDAMPCASGRDVMRLAAVSKRAGVHVIATTGLHTPKFYPGHRWALEASADVLAELFVADIETGIDRFDYTGPVVERTDHRAGILKIVTSGTTITERDRRLFEAAAITHERTGVPILTHCEEGVGAPEQLALLAELGVPLTRVVLSHTDKITDPTLHKELLSSGVNLEYDQALRQATDEEPATARLLAEMIAAGFLGQLMLGTDGARRTLWATLGGTPGLAWLLTGFTAILASHGIDADARRELLVANPARFLAMEAT